MTALGEALAGVARLGMDTAPVIYYVEEHARYLSLVAPVFDAIDNGALEAVTSVITLTEVLVHPLQRNASELQSEYLDLLLNSANFETWPIDTLIARRAAELRARFNVRTPDALQLATALTAGCQAFITNDAALKRVADLRVLVLDELEP